MFKSSNRPSLGRRMMEFAWPRHGFRRAWNYRMRRLARLKSCPHRISLGFGAGAFASFTPFVGFHFIIAAAVAFLIRGNLLASAVGTIIGNPLTFPLIWYSTYKLGSALIGGEASDGAGAGDAVPAYNTPSGARSLGDLARAIESSLWPMLIGAVPLGLACACACYCLVYFALRPLQRNVPART